MGNPNSKDHSSVNDDFVTLKSYKGETKHGKRHGQGLYLYPNGDVYDGQWRKSRKYGRGIYTYADGKSKLDGFFYHDEYIGKEPNEKIKQRMAKKKGDHLDNCSPQPITERSELSNGRLEATTEPEVKFKSDGGSERRAQSMRRNKWVRDKYHIDGSAESLDTATRKRYGDEPNGSTTKNKKRSFSFGSKKHKNTAMNDFNEGVERKNSKRLRESIRQKYNLPRRERPE